MSWRIVSVSSLAKLDYKLAPNQTAVEAQVESLRKNKPPAGVVEVLTITEKQYARMEMIVGSRQGDIVNTVERYVEL